nr:conserved oligomeric Golgi complex subunit 8-like [Drosophila kikkawai]
MGKKYKTPKSPKSPKKGHQADMAEGEGISTAPATQTSAAASTAAAATMEATTTNAALALSATPAAASINETISVTLPHQTQRGKRKHHSDTSAATSSANNSGSDGSSSDDGMISDGLHNGSNDGIHYESDNNNNNAVPKTNNSSNGCTSCIDNNNNTDKVLIDKEELLSLRTEIYLLRQRLANVERGSNIKQQLASLGLAGNIQQFEGNKFAPLFEDDHEEDDEMSEANEDICNYDAEFPTLMESMDVDDDGNINYIDSSDDDDAELDEILGPRLAALRAAAASAKAAATKSTSTSAIAAAKTAAAAKSSTGAAFKAAQQKQQSTTAAAVAAIKTKMPIIAVYNAEPKAITAVGANIVNVSPTQTDDGKWQGADDIGFTNVNQVFDENPLRKIV